MEEDEETENKIDILDLLESKDIRDVILLSEIFKAPYLDQN